jgi:hypothetical protein
MIKNVHCSCEVSVITVIFLIKLEFSRQLFKNYSNTKFHKIRPMAAELFHAEGRTYGQTDRRTGRQYEANGCGCNVNTKNEVV